MSNQMRVAGASDIPAAIEFVKKHVVGGKGPGAMVCPLVCEELLLRLLGLGCVDIRVSAKGVKVKHVEITARGGRADIVVDRSKDESGLGVQISDCLLDQYGDYFTFRYRDGVNEYCVYTEKQNVIDLSGEIFDFYSHIDPQKKPGAMAVLWHIVGNHRGFFAASVVVHLFKHLGALERYESLDQLISDTEGEAEA